MNTPFKDQSPTNCGLNISKECNGLTQVILRWGNTGNKNQKVETCIPCGKTFQQQNSQIVNTITILPII